MIPKTVLLALLILILTIATLLTIACGSETPTSDRVTEAPPTDAETTASPASKNDAEPRTNEPTEAKVETRTKEPTGAGPGQQTTSTPSEGTMPTERAPTNVPPTTPRTDPAEPTPQSPEDTPAAPATATPAPTGGICPRNPAVKQAIMNALSASSCADVTPTDLAQVDSLTVKTATVEAEDVAGLSSITTLHLEFTGPPQAHLGALTTLKNVRISITLPPNEERDKTDGTLYKVADDFLPHGETYNQYGEQVPNPNPEGHFDTLEFVISGGPTPRDTGYVTMSHQLLDRRYKTNHITIRDSSTHAYGILRYNYAYPDTQGQLLGQSAERFTLFLNREDQSEKGSMSATYNWLPRDFPSRIEIVNEDPNMTIRLPENFMARDRYLHAAFMHDYELEISGRMVISTGAFKEARGLVQLDLSLDSGHPHYLAFASDIEPPQGTGFTVAGQ